ncbi:MAG: hypothetical protein K6D97_02570 [Clostridia bacterium]|nr:hypothetical protein [Clostridia bacterium]
MKLQGFSVIFVLVCIPLLLVLSYYISLQIDTITMQNEYNSKLLSATYDAVSAFELNTANEDLSTVSDSLRTIIEASNNIFFNTLATNMGLSNASKAYIEPYIPSVLYTLYDGYYIFAPTTIPVVKTDKDGVAVTVGQDFVSYDGNEYIFEEPDESNENASENWNRGITSVGKLCNTTNLEDYGQLLYVSNDSDDKLTTNPDEAKTQIKNVLKSYMPYSARYKASAREPGEATAYPYSWENVSYDFNIIYTLDNFITVEGFVQDANNNDFRNKIYYTESGYLIKDTDEGKTVVKLNGEVIEDYNQNAIQSIIENADPEKSNADEVVIEISKNGNLQTSFSTADLKSVEEIIGEDSDKYILLGEEIDEYEHKPKDRLLFLTLQSDRWNEKNLKEKYDVLLTILKNRYKEIEEMPVDGFIDVVDDDSIKKVDVLNNLNSAINKTQYNLDLLNSIVYYAKAKMFTKWVTTHLSMIQANDIVEISGMDFGTIQEGLLFGTRDNYDEDGAGRSDFQTLISFKDDSSKIFSSNSFKAIKGNSKIYDDSATELGKDSVFNNHKLRIIRASIQYSLNLAMTTYNSNESYGIIGAGEIRRGSTQRVGGYAMPVLQYEEWESITENPSVVAFMQGLRCGLKVYNNYAVVSSTNNELTVRPENICYVADDGEYQSFNSGYINNTDYYYHKINCPGLLEDIDDVNTRVTSFSSKEAKYDKMYDKMASQMKYKYDHKNLACYTCINDGNYSDRSVDIFDINNDVTGKKPALRKAFYLATGKERNNVYKMNAFKDSYGTQTLWTFTNHLINKCDISQVRALKITFGLVQQGADNTEQTVAFKLTYKGTPLSDRVYSITTKVQQIYNITFENNLTLDHPGYEEDIYECIGFSDVTNGVNPGTLKNSIRFIEAVYK